MPASKQEIRLRTGHGRLLEEISGTVTDTAVESAGDPGAFYTSIHNASVNFQVPAEHVDSCAAADEVLHHLAGDHRRVKAKAFFSDSVIAAECVNATADGTGASRHLEFRPALQRPVQAPPSCLVAW